MAKEQKNKRKKKNALILLSLACLAFAAGYYTGRGTSINWNSENTAFLYACRASHRLKNAPDGAVLVLPLPDAEYRYDGKEVKEIPIASVVATERYPVVGGDEYEAWLNSIVAFGAGAGAKTAWDIVTDSSELKGFQRVLAEERVLLSIVTVGAFGGGYLDGHKFQPSFEGPLFRAPLRDNKEWKRIQSYKDQMLDSKHQLDEAKKNIQVAKDVGSPTDKKTIEVEKRINREYATLLMADPDLKD
jgi:hypothetical protein